MKSEFSEFYNGVLTSQIGSTSRVLVLYHSLPRHAIMNNEYLLLCSGQWFGWPLHICEIAKGYLADVLFLNICMRQSGNFWRNTR